MLACQKQMNSSSDYTYVIFLSLTVIFLKLCCNSLNLKVAYSNSINNTTSELKKYIAVERGVPLDEVEASLPSNCFQNTINKIKFLCKGFYNLLLIPFKRFILYFVSENVFKKRFFFYNLFILDILFFFPALPWLYITF